MTKNYMMKAGLVIATLALLVLPVLTQAATYAYVDNSGNVRSVVANDWQTAIATAFNIYIHSGVLLLTSTGDFGIIGDNAGGF